MSIQENIRKYRKQRGLTQEELAETMGVSCAAVSKWENGQCAPDLSTLAALADYFEISVDTLLDHRVRADRLESLLGDLERAADSHETDRAEELCEKLLRNYPNDPKVVDRCACVLYQLYIHTLQDRYMERCIRETKRLFALKQGEPETDRLERLRYLGNQYELLGRWEQAMEYYEQSNSEGCVSGRIADCLLHLGRTEEALNLVSETIINDLFRTHLNVSTLADIWEGLGEQEKACEALEWMSAALEKIRYSPTVVQLVLLKLTSLRFQQGDRASAKEAAERMKQLGTEVSREKEAEASFLKPGKPQKLMISENIPGAVLKLIRQVEEL